MAILVKIVDKTTFIIENTGPETASVPVVFEGCDGIEQDVERFVLKPNNFVEITNDSDGVYNIDGNKFPFVFNTLENFVNLFHLYVCPCNNKQDENLDFDVYSLMMVYANYINSMYNLPCSIPPCLNFPLHCPNKDFKSDDIKRLLGFYFYRFYKTFKGIYNNEIYYENLFDISDSKCCLQEINNDYLTNFSGTVTISPDITQLNKPPVNIGDGNIIFNCVEDRVVFTGREFTNDYQDPEGDPIENIKILSLPENGFLVYDSIGVIIGQEIPLSGIQSGLLEYVPILPCDKLKKDSFDFTVSDTGSHMYYNT